MKYYHYFFLLFITTTYSQNAIYFTTGRNFTTYSYTNSLDTQATNISSAMGNSYSLGYSKELNLKINKRSLFYDFELAIDELNSSVYNKNLLVNWNTVYTGFRNSLLFPIISHKQLRLDLKLGAMVSTMVQGTQELNGELFDLSQTDSFKGVFFSGIGGIQAQYNASDYSGLRLGYDYQYGFNPSLKSPEQFSTLTNRIWFGVVFNLSSKSQQQVK
jgi:hypothetical protein